MRTPLLDHLSEAGRLPKVIYYLLKWPACLLDKLFFIAAKARSVYYNLTGPQYRSKTPVISIGNLSTGGTGKTPMCLWLASKLSSKGLEVAIVMRGYHQGSGESDEAKIYASQLGAEHVYIGANRIENMKVLEKKSYDCVLLDDGFQHRQLGRDYDIVLLNSAQPPMEDFLLPRGFLREDLGALKRADMLIWTRCEMQSEMTLDRMEKDLSRRFPLLPQIRSQTTLKSIVNLEGENINVRKESYYVICGIGHPENFFQMIEREGLDVLEKKALKDHHDYSDKEIKKLCQKAEAMNASRILMTEKDIVKWKGRCDYPLAYVKIQPDLGGKEDRLVQIVIDKIEDRKNAYQ